MPASPPKPPAKPPANTAAKSALKATTAPAPALSAPALPAAKPAAARPGFPLSPHGDGKCRCPWCGTDPLYMAYHDTEWGVPERDDRALFEKLVLDGFQAGLAWITILRKRDNFRRAFDGFDPEVIARYGPEKQAALMQDVGIVRNRAKIEGAVLSARAYLDLRDKGIPFSQLMWSSVDGQVQVNRPRGYGDVPAETPASQALSKRLKAAGFKFCGPTIVYAAMQACGLVNDHFVGCHCLDEA